ncbi:MAG: polysaccharide biosynthesis/export family protein [Isosphaeraceae bacterium]
MIAGKLSARICSWLSLCAAIAFVATVAGCGSHRTAHALRKIPHPGVIDCNQPRELRMVSMPQYVVEPPDELELAVRPATDDLSSTNLTVQADGNLDLGFAGDVYVAGLTLEQIEQKIALHLDQLAAAKGDRTRYKVSVRLANGSQSKYYYVLGTVNTQGKFPVSGNDTVLDAILTAGLKSNSYPEKAYLVRPRPAGGPDQILKIDWVGIRERGDTLTNYQIFPGDRIIVPGGPSPGLLGTLLGG